MNSTVLPAIAGEIQMHMDTIEKLKASIQIELDEIKVLEDMRDSYFKNKTIIVPVETVAVKAIVPSVPVETVAEKPIVPAVLVKKATKKTIGTQDSLLSPDDYLSVDKKRNVLSNDKKLTDTDFDIYQQFDAKCIHKEKVKAKYNLYYEGQLLHWINEKGEYSSTYTSGTNFTPFGPNNGDPFKASLFGRTNQKVKGWLFFGTQSNPTSAKTSAKNSEQTSEQTSEQISKIDMDNEKEFPSLEGK